MTEPACTDLLLREDKDGCCRLILNRPDRLNALNTALFEQLDAQLARLEQELDTIGCVVISGAGRSFCAGADLVALAGGVLPPPAFKPGVIERLANLPIPVIAAVHGNCVTGGLELVLAADFILADATAKFADTHGKWGLVGGWGMSQRLPRRISLPRAKAMMLTSRFVLAEEALAIGLIDQLAPAGELATMVDAMAAAILANSAFTNRETKRLLLATDGMSLRDGLAHENYRHPGLAPDYAERVATFTRKP